MRFKKTLLAIHVALAAGMLAHSGGAAAGSCSVDGSTLNCTTSIYWAPGDTSTYEKIVIDTTGENQSFTPTGFGIYGNSSKYTLKDVSITTASSKSDAIQANNGGSKISIDKLHIVTKGSSADGINVTENALNSEVRVGDGAIITAEGSGMGVRANTSKNGGKNLIELGAGAQITTNGSGANSIDGTGYAVYAGNRSLSANTYWGDAEVILGDGSTIVSKGSSAHAVYANRGGVIRLGDTSITTEKTNAYGIYAQTAADKNGDRGGQVYLGGDTSVTVTDGNRALYASGADSLIRAEAASVYRLDSSAASDVQNRKGVALYADKTGVIDLKMAAGSYLNGTTSTATDGVIDLAMDGATSQWFMTGNSNLTNLTLTNGAQLVYDRHDEHGAYTYKTLTVDGDFSGGGHLVMNTYLGDDTSETDKLAITGSTSGETRVTVNNTTGLGDETEQGIEMITVGGTSAGEFKSDRVTAGGYEYVLRRGGSFVGSTGADSDWYLTSYKPNDPDPEDPPPVDPPPVDPPPVDPPPVDPPPVDPPGPVDPTPEAPIRSIPRRSNRARGPSAEAQRQGPRAPARRRQLHRQHRGGQHHVPAPSA